MTYVKSECEKCTYRKCAGVGRLDCESWQRYLLAKSEQTALLLQERKYREDAMGYIISKVARGKKRYPKYK